MSPRHDRLRTRGTGRLLALGCAFALVTTLAVGESATPAGAATTPVRAIELNMQGLIAQTSHTPRLEGLAYVVNRLNVELPIAVALNEICPSQAHYLTVAFEGVYEVMYLPSYERPGTAASAGCELWGGPAQYGNAIMMRHTPIWTDGFFYTETDYPSTRNMVCLQTAYGYISFMGCSTHLSSSGVTPAQRTSQQNEFLYGITFWPGGIRLGMGDINADRPDVVPLLHWNFLEADVNTPKRPTADGGAPIDYVFGLRSVSTLTQNAVISNDLSFSDHRATKGFHTYHY